ncbi:MAG: hypothetical protein ABFE02_02865 [Sulfuricella sp.]
MNKISSLLLSLCLMCAGSLAFAMDSMDKNGAMEKDTMSKDAMKKEGAMMKAQPKKMQKKNDKMEQGEKMERGDGMSMEPRK